MGYVQGYDKKKMLAKLGIPGLHINDFTVSGGNASFYEYRTVTRFLKFKSLTPDSEDKKKVLLHFFCIEV